MRRRWRHCYSNTLFSNATHTQTVLSLRKDHMTMYYIGHSTVLNLHCTVLFYSMFNKRFAKIHTRYECRKVLSFCPVVLGPIHVFVEKEVRNKRCFRMGFNIFRKFSINRRCIQVKSPFGRPCMPSTGIKGGNMDVIMTFVQGECNSKR